MYYSSQQDSHASAEIRTQAQDKIAQATIPAVAANTNPCISRSSSCCLCLHILTPPLEELIALVRQQTPENRKKHEKPELASHKLASTLSL